MSRVILLVLSWGAAVSPGVSSASAVRNLAGVPCGKVASNNNNSRMPRIMGGTTSNIMESPYAVSLQTKNGEHFCGGSLVHRYYVVTAAHCIDFAKPELLVAGDQNSAMMDARTEQHLHAETIIKHPDYNPRQLLHDIAIIRLKEPVEWTEWVQPVCLPGSNENLKEGTPTYLVGWGYDQQYGEMTEELHRVQLPIVSNEQCQDYLGSRIKIKDEHLCAGHEEGEKDGCQADSGGGLVSLRTGHTILSGVMMGGVGCGRARLPGVYTRVQKYFTWIESIVNEDNNSNRQKRSTIEEEVQQDPMKLRLIQGRSDRPRAA